MQLSEPLFNSDRRTKSLSIEDDKAHSNTKVAKPLFSMPTFNMFQPSNNDSNAIRVLSMFESQMHSPTHSQHATNQVQYPVNTIITSRYTILTYFPKSMLEQFRRLANVYFLVIGIIASIGYYTHVFETAVEPVGILAPMMIVISISMIKEGIEDIKRHNTDKKINMRPTRQVGMDGIVKACEWQDLRVGDIVLLFRDDDIPADTIVLACGGMQGAQCYVETAALDGETNLKIRQPCLQEDKLTEEQRGTSSVSRFPKITMSDDKRRIDGLTTLIDRMKVQAEPPNEYVYKFNGSVDLKADNNNNTSNNNNSNGKGDMTMALTEKNLLLRGSTLRATEWVVGMVVYTGKDTKLSLNSKTPPSKLSSVDRIVNRTLAIAISVMICVCILSMVFEIFWQSSNNDANYLCIHQNDLNYYNTNNGGGCENSTTSSVLTIFTFATLYNNFVCISMYVSLEMVYICQAYFLSQDVNVYDEATDSPAECHSSGMCADLGQVKYVLSDKTGTLTKNIMNVRRVSVLGKVFGAPVKTITGSPGGAGGAGSSSAKINDSFVTTDSQHSALHVDLSAKYDKTNNSFVSTGGGSVRGMESDASSKNWSPLEHMHPSNVDVFATHEEKAVMADFLRVLAACNTVMLMPDQTTDGFGSTAVVNNLGDLVKSLQAESADEVALVLAAVQHSGVMLTGRGNTVAEVRGLQRRYRESQGNLGETDVENIEILAINEFESNRKRMSVLTRIGHRYVLLCKGADTSMMTQCRRSPSTDPCLEHIEVFATNGLRTLIAAKRDLDDASANAWLAEYNIAKASVVDRHEKLSQCAMSIEQDMDLLGAIGIEDELQDGAPDAIQMMQNGGINVWMITGDKAETAIAIGKMCALIREGYHVVEKVIGLGDDALRHRINELSQRIESRAAQLGLSSYRDPQKDLALVIDGTSLEGVLRNADLKDKLSSLLPVIPTVVACRVSPLQKAALVRMVKNSNERPVTLAIGDGANDVGMIHEARVGVGISGREGRHAANSADFAISQFRFLVPLLFEHGRFNYIRCSKLVLYSFFKNLLLVSTLFYFCLYSGFSGTLPVTSLVFSGYNFYLGLPIIALGALDFDVPRSFVYNHPELAYRTGRNGELLNSMNMLRWCIVAFLEGLLLFALCIRFIGGYTAASQHYGNDNGSSNSGFLNINGVGQNLNENGRNGGLYVDGFLLYTTTVMAMQYKVMAMTYTRTSINWFVWIVSFLGYLFFTYLYGLSTANSWVNVTVISLKLPQVWISVAVVPVMVTYADAAIDWFFSTIRPSSMDSLRLLYENGVKDGTINKYNNNNNINNNNNNTFNKSGMLDNDRQLSKDSTQFTNNISSFSVTRSDSNSAT